MLKNENSNPYFACNFQSPIFYICISAGMKVLYKLFVYQRNPRIILKGVILSIRPLLIIPSPSLVQNKNYPKNTSIILAYYDFMLYLPMFILLSGVT